MNETLNLWPLHLEDTEEDFTNDMIATLAAPVIWPRHKETGIYFLLDDDRIVYIGKSTNLRSRFEQHANTKSEKVYNRYFYIFCKEENLDKTEAYYILQFRPKYNIAIPGKIKHETHMDQTVS